METEEAQKRKRVPSVSPKNRGLPLPPSLGLFSTALAPGAWKFNLFTVLIKNPGRFGSGECFTIQIKIPPPLPATLLI